MDKFYDQLSIEQFPRGVDVTYVPKSRGCGLTVLTIFLSTEEIALLTVL